MAGGAPPPAPDPPAPDPPAPAPPVACGVVICCRTNLAMLAEAPGSAGIVDVAVAFAVAVISLYKYSKLNYTAYE